MTSICWRVLAPKFAIPVHIHALNPFKTSFKSLKSERHWSMLIMMTFQSTSTRPMMWYSLLPLGMRKMVAHVNSLEKYPVPNYSCIISTTIHHLV